VHISSISFRPYDILPTRIVHTTKDFRRYLLNTYGEINTFLFLVHTAIKNLDLDLEHLDLHLNSSHVVLADMDLKLVDTRYKSAN